MTAPASTPAFAPATTTAPGPVADESPSDGVLTVASFNQERNGMGDPGRRRAAYQLVNELGVQLLLRQEMPGADQDQHAVMYEAEDATGLRGWLSEGSATAVFADTTVFRPFGHWPNPWSGFKLPPTAVTLQLRQAGPESTPIIAVAAHLNYAVPVQREIEAGWLTTYNDKWITLASGRRRHAVVIAGLDANSYPSRAATAEPALPDLAAIKDHPHRAHRSRMWDGQVRLMDQVPHATLHTAGLIDIAAHLSPAPRMSHTVDPTMLAYDTHGPDARVDWLVASRAIVPVFYDVEVIDTQDISDHNLVVGRARRSELARMLTDLTLKAA